jgi:hypothetical protein
MSRENKWLTFFDKLSADFPLKAGGDDGDTYPQMSSAIDDGVDDLLRDSDLKLLGTSNPLYVEDLLRDCTNRISNCLLLREKAQDVEARAIAEALYYRAQRASIRRGSEISKVLDEMAPRIVQNATSITIAEGKVTFIGDDKTWANVRNEHRDLASELMEVVEAQKSKASTEGNGANFVERFRFLKRLFDLNIEQAYRRALITADALNQIYRINEPVPKIKPIGYLDELAIWAQKASDRLDRELDVRYSGRLVFALCGAGDALRPNELVTRTQFKAQMLAGSFQFTLVSAPFEKAGMKEVLLRSIQVQVEPVDASPKVRLWPITLKLPHSALTQSNESFATVAASMFHPPVDIDSVVRGVHNISPVGEWTIQIPDHEVTGDVTKDAVKNLYLFITVSYRRLDNVG